MRRSDVPWADSLRALAGWNQNRADWRRLLRLEPDGCFVAEWADAPAGTATTLVYGIGLAWIGMVLVHPDLRRRGVGTALLEHSLAHLERRGVRCVKLDATPAGRPVYERLGFKPEAALTRWEAAASGPPRPARHPARTWDAGAVGRVAGLDLRALGVARLGVLRALARASTSALLIESPSGRVTGFGLARPGARANYLGPVVATSGIAAHTLLDGLLAACERRRVFCDLRDDDAAAVAWARRRGFVRQREFTRMYRGENLRPANPRLVIASAGPEIG